MTIEAWAIKHLTDNGMFPQEAGAVIAAVKTQMGDVMACRWSDDAEGYPGYLLAVLVLALNSNAVEWIDANKPKHWARMVFDQSTPKPPAGGAQALNGRGAGLCYSDGALPAAIGNLERDRGELYPTAVMVFPLARRLSRRCRLNSTDSISAYFANSRTSDRHR
jgi:hypothetical protein